VTTSPQAASCQRLLCIPVSAGAASGELGTTAINAVAAAVGRKWRFQRDEEREYYDEDRLRFRVKICREYENGDEVCRYRN